MALASPGRTWLTDRWRTRRRDTVPATELKQRWRAGEATYGAAIRLNSTWAVEVFAHAGLDFIWIDLQHGFVPEHLLMPMLQAMNGFQATSLVRVAANDPVLIGRALDAGSEGVIVPMVQTREDAERAVAACRYEPAGVRSHSALRLGYLPGGIHREVICLVMIETELGVRNAAEITAVPGVDGVFVGPSDLALSMGLEPSGLQPGRHADAIDAVLKACRDNGVVTALTGEPEAMKAMGVKMISLGSDNLFLMAGMKAALSKR
jgi:4-hydroxy-2-oxoheptanedioate aldolase